MDPAPAHVSLRSQFAVLQGGKHRMLQGEGGTADVAPYQERRPTLAWRSRLPIAVAFGVAAVALVLWFASARSGPAALRELPAEERAALVERTRSNLHEICSTADRPRDFCREQASLLLGLPECQGDCQAEARGELMADSAVK
jgi:cytochrome b pre-mRNA-processing protein 3